MPAYSFIGTEKNAGKTTALNFCYQQYRERYSPILMTSIGINGEKFDSFTDLPKPEITLLKGDYCLTSQESLKNLDGHYSIIDILRPPTLQKTFLLIQLLTSRELVIEGPNTQADLLEAKRAIYKNLGEKALLLIDGSINRQFIGSPKISDALVLAVTIPREPRQIRKRWEKLDALFLPPYEGSLKEAREEEIKSLVYDKQMKLLHRGTLPPFQDKEMKIALQSGGRTLYLNGALTNSLASFLSHQIELTVVVDNFTLINCSLSAYPKLKKNLYLYGRVPIKNIFVKNCGLSSPTPPWFESLTWHNLFREVVREIRV